MIFKNKTPALLLITFGFTTFGYEMLIGTALAQIMGDSIYYFSLTIATFILFMGIGSFLSNTIKFNIREFVVLEIFLFVFAQFACPAIFFTAGYQRSGAAVLVVAAIFTFVIGVIAGAEIPVLYNLLKANKSNSGFFSELLIFDYLGSLAAALLFSLLLLPKLHLFGTNYFISLCGLGMLQIFVFSFEERSVKLKIGILVAIIVNVSLFVCEDTIQRKIELQIFKITENTKIESSFQTPYQKVLVTSTPVFDFEEKGTQKPSQWVSVYLNNYLQSQAMLDDKTDYYHHSFVHPAMLLSTDRKNILILGGGDGFPAKEVEKYSDAQKITIVDLDKQWTDFSSTDALMTSVNNKALTDPRVEIINADAFQWVRKSKLKYDVIMVDFPEGLDTALARSYSKEFILDLSKILSDSGIVSFETETFLDKSFWSVVKTIKKNGFHVLIHHTVHPESESNGLILMSKLDIDINRLYSFDSQFTFIRPEFFISKKEIEELNQSEFIQRQIKDIDENSFFKPTFLKYYKSQWPWKITIGAGIN